MLGPKMYNAQVTFQDDNHHGSTRLHLDLTDAVNIMIWASNLVDGKPGYAIWHIFAAEALPLLRRFLIEEGVFKGKGISVHSQAICMTPAVLQRLFDKYGIRPYIIHQYVGQAVYIPAGCAHQV
jgi:lysine-specific demethylase 3